MPDLSLFAALAAKSGTVAPVAPASLAGATTQIDYEYKQYQQVSRSVAPVAPVAPQNGVTVDENDLIDAFEERAAIMEYDGGMSRQEAEAMAWTAIFGSRARAA